MTEEINEERWQNKINSLRQGIAHIYETKEFYDVQFLVKGEYYFKAHRLVLAARSSEFAKLLLIPNAVDLFIVDEETVTQDGFEVLLRFIYTGNMGTTDKQSIVEAYIAALYYKLKSLQDKCLEAIDCWIITVDDVCHLFEVGINVHLLKSKCLQFMINNGKAVINSPSFPEMSLGGLCSMLKCGALAKIPVLQRIDAVMQWFHKQHNSNIDYLEIRNILQTCSDIPLLGTLNFELLSLNELSEVIDKYDGLITAEENLKFMKYHRNKDASKLPEWCVIPSEQ